jgi:NAD(P)-dependent dehydrogenase (short-subunit alcohol dehydrogenase family)
VIGFTRALATEVGVNGVTVNAIAPGLTRTETAASGMPVSAFDDVAAQQSIKRVEMPEDLVGTVAFLTSDDAAFITGQTICVDGGFVRL